MNSISDTEAGGRWFGRMIRSFLFTTQGQLQSQQVDLAALHANLQDPNLFVWLDLQQPSAEEAKQVLEDLFHFHPLSIEDCLAANSCPKVEEYSPREEDQFAPYLFVVMHGVDYNRQDGKFATSELNFFLAKNYLITVHELPLRSVSQVADLVIKGSGRPPRGPDRVMHLLLDALVEHYEPALDELSAEIGKLEEQALARPTPQTLNSILAIKKEVQHLRAIVLPQREVLSRFAHAEFKLVRPHLVPYYRDVYDSLLHIDRLAQNYADSLTGILQAYLNMSSNQTGEIVKVLTLITVITTPLMMIGTWYGMNFRDMPELSWRRGYAVAAGAMVLSTAATFWYFKKKKWF
jgi:magnesium transporter